MAFENPKTIGQALLQRHGLRAEAVAAEHLAEARSAGDAAAMAGWQRVQTAVSELSRTRRQAQSQRAAVATANAEW